MVWYLGPILLVPVVDFASGGGSRLRPNNECDWDVIKGPVVGDDHLVLNFHCGVFIESEIDIGEGVAVGGDTCFSIPLVGNPKLYHPADIN